MQKGLSVEERREQDLGNIFRTMVYNENQPENFGPILKWLACKEYKVSSLVGEENLTTTSKSVDLRLGDCTLSVLSIGEKSVPNIISNVKRTTKVPWNKKLATESFSKFETLMKTLASDLLLLEAIVSRIPAWQVQEYDQQRWNLTSMQKNLPHLVELSKSDVSHVVLNTADISSVHVRDMIMLLSLSTQLPGRFMISICLDPEDDESGFQALSLAYLLSEFNKAEVRNCPVDLLIHDSPKAASLQELLTNNLEQQFVMWKNINDFPHLPMEIIAGSVTSYGIPSVQFFVDSRVDLATCVESISAMTWCSGSAVRQRARSLAFVHLPVYKKLIELLEKKISSLRISSSFPAHKSTDFIRRSVSSSLDIEGALKLGVKCYPTTPDPTSPCLLYDIGTSVDIVANKHAGLAHVLCIIPYRSQNEAAALTNVFGPDVTNYVFTSDTATAKTFANKLIGEDIWVNSTGKDDEGEELTNINGWLFVQASAAEDKSRNIALGDQTQHVLKLDASDTEKSAKSWSKSKLTMRWKAVDDVISQHHSVDKYQCLLKLVPDTLNRFLNNGWENEEGEWVVSRSKPLGAVAIVVMQPANISKEVLFHSILSTTLQGNVAIVISVGSSFENETRNAFHSSFPRGVVRFEVVPSAQSAMATIRANWPLLKSATVILSSGQTLPSQLVLDPECPLPIYIQQEGLSTLRKSLVQSSKVSYG